MNQSDIARKHDVSRTFVKDLKKGKRLTTDFELAKTMGEFTGKDPVVFISEKLRDIYRKFYEVK